ncbi:MFS transporter [Cypionkella sp.]|uniref:MFS transporter n=1 Tax=Cypionkella sp. TaxID=2811411 RepID=UPI002AC951C4|nr:MFS transporter [Cypionkella sp.]
MTKARFACSHAAMTQISLWQNRNFRLMFASSAATNLGDGLIAVAVAWLATLLTDDPFLIGLVATARHLPWFLFALPAGVITDRVDHRRLIIGADCVRIVISLALLTLALMANPGTGPVLLMAALSFVLGSAEVLRDNTAQTFTPSVVEKSQLEQANGAMWSTEQLAGQFIGPPLAGLLIGLSIALPFGIQAGLLAVAVVLTISMNIPKREQTTPHLPMLAALKEGMLWLWRDIPLRRLAFILGGFNFIGYGFAAVLVLYSQRVLGLDAFGFGIFLTLAACGGLAATLIGPRILRHIRPRSAILLGMLGFTVAALALALQAPLWLIAIFMVLDGFSGMLWNIAQVSYRQRHIPAPLLGRVNSAFRFIGTGPAAFGAFTFGWLISWAGSGAEPWGTAQAVLLPYWVAAAIGGGLTLYAAARLQLR